MYTEAEALTLWCPMVRHEGNHSTFNRGWATHNPLNMVAGAPVPAFACNCIATRCASWRWTQASPLATVSCADTLAAHEPERPVGMPATWSFIPSLFGVTSAHWTAPRCALLRRGYCGLSGHPMSR